MSYDILADANYPSCPPIIQQFDSRCSGLQAISQHATMTVCWCLMTLQAVVAILTTEIMRRMKDRPGSQRSLKALFSSLPGPFAVALKVITLQNSLAVIARQQACTSHHNTITKSISFLLEAASMKKSMMSCTHSTKSGTGRIQCQMQLSSEAAHVSSSHVYVAYAMTTGAPDTDTDNRPCRDGYQGDCVNLRLTLIYVHHSRELATAANHRASVWLGCRT